MIEMPRSLAAPSHPLILVVDDEEMVREIVGEILTQAGYRVMQVGSGPEALARLTQFPDISLMVSDVMMPGMDGFELASAAVQLRPELGVVFITGYSVRQPQPLARLLLKPFRVERLLAFVAEALRT